MPSDVTVLAGVSNVYDSLLQLTTLAAGGDAAPAQGMGGFLMPILIVGIIFYFLVFRPASRERKERESLIKNVKKHDKVVTNAGIHGVVTNLDEDSVVLRVDDKNNVRIRFSRAAIWQVLTGAEGESASSS
jgi:preprotein translocase subunit YajC